MVLVVVRSDVCGCWHSLEIFVDETKTQSAMRKYLAALCRLFCLAAPLLPWLGRNHECVQGGLAASAMTKVIDVSK